MTRPDDARPHWDGWVAFNGCCEPGGAHRATVLPVNGSLHFAQRFAIDWMQLDAEGRFVHGDPSDVRSYTSYGRDVLAIADATVLETRNDLPDQVPGKDPDPTTLSLETVDGNHVVLDLGNGRYAMYAHLRPGSVVVAPGARVSRGQVIGKLGNTGNTSAPHLHFQMMDGASPLGSERIPYVLERFSAARMGGVRDDDDVLPFGTRVEGGCVRPDAAARCRAWRGVRNEVRGPSRLQRRDPARHRRP